eukprot:TRINITY_DN2690_c0_g1_i2.p1 TRINITY_DN2690_c0_g1~~TRINITY_DN2690_c0_g1_i2.p1  ORF type:complete len:209 (+),score=41.14 TRINITY_DN2690_c0_g1_i2:58-684(+)
MLQGSFSLSPSYGRSILRVLRRPDGSEDSVTVLGFDDVHTEATRVPWVFAAREGNYWKLGAALKPYLAQLSVFHDYDPSTEGWVLAEVDGRPTFVDNRADQRNDGCAPVGTEVELRGRDGSDCAAGLEGLQGTVVGHTLGSGPAAPTRMMVQLPGDGWPGYGRPLVVAGDNVREVRQPDESSTVVLDPEASPARYRARALLPRQQEPK